MERDAGQYEKAAASFRKSLESAVDYETQARALSELGTLYVKEQVPEAHPGQGIELLKDAEKRLYPRATLLLGDAYFYVKPEKQNIPLATNYYREVLGRYPEAGLAMAEITAGKPESLTYFNNALAMAENMEDPTGSTALRIARMFTQDTVVARNDEAAVKWYKRAVAANNPGAAMQLARYYQENGHLPESDVVALWEKAAELNHPQALAVLGFAYDTGWVVAKDPQKAQTFFDRAVQIDPYQAYRIGRMYEKRQLTFPQETENKLKALQWFEVAANKNQPDGLLRMGRAYWRGEGRAINKTLARDYYTKATAAGSLKAGAELARYEEQDRRHAMEMARKEQERFIKQQKQAREKLYGGTTGKPFAEVQKMAQQGNAVAMREVGAAYLSGNNVEQDTGMAIEWLEKAGNAGDVPAMRALARTYSSGAGVTMDMAQAYKWYQKAAEAGDAESQYQLGLGYARGLGVKKDTALAKQWLSKARANGYQMAETLLESLNGGATTKN